MLKRFFSNKGVVIWHAQFPFGRLAEQQCLGLENRERRKAAWVQFLHRPPFTLIVPNSRAEHPPYKRKNAEHYRAGPPVLPSHGSATHCKPSTKGIMKTVIRYQSQLLPRRSYKPGRKIRITFRPSPGGVVIVENPGKKRVPLPGLEPAIVLPN
jgi:hypothetical protein